MVYWLIITPQFNSGWPVNLKVDTAGQLLSGVNFNNIDTAAEAKLSALLGSFDDDNIHLNGLSTIQGSAGTYMAAVAPWFFTHFGGSLNKNVSMRIFCGASTV